MTRIDRYIARLIFVPLMATLVLAAMLLPALAAWHRPGTESP